MTRKDFNAIASALASTRPQSTGYDARAYDTWAETRTAIASVLANSNPLFDRARFNTACHAD